MKKMTLVLGLLVSSTSFAASVCEGDNVYGLKDSWKQMSPIAVAKMAIEKGLSKRITECSEYKNDQEISREVGGISKNEMSGEILVRISNKSPDGSLLYSVENITFGNESLGSCAAR